MKTQLNLYILAPFSTFTISKTFYKVLVSYTKHNIAKQSNRLTLFFNNEDKILNVIDSLVTLLHVDVAKNART
jgi:hypothetical protein